MAWLEVPKLELLVDPGVDLTPEVLDALLIAACDRVMLFPAVQRLIKIQFQALAGIHALCSNQDGRGNENVHEEESEESEESKKNMEAEESLKESKAEDRICAEMLEEANIKIPDILDFLKYGKRSGETSRQMQQHGLIGTEVPRQEDNGLFSSKQQLTLPQSSLCSRSVIHAADILKQTHTTLLDEALPSYEYATDKAPYVDVSTTPAAAMIFTEEQKFETLDSDQAPCVEVPTAVTDLRRDQFSFEFLNTGGDLTQIAVPLSCEKLHRPYQDYVEDCYSTTSGPNSEYDDPGLVAMDAVLMTVHTSVYLNESMCPSAAVLLPTVPVSYDSSPGVKQHNAESGFTALDAVMTAYTADATQGNKTEVYANEVWREFSIVPKHFVPLSHAQLQHTSEDIKLVSTIVHVAHMTRQIPGPMQGHIVFPEMDAAEAGPAGSTPQNFSNRDKVTAKLADEGPNDFGLVALDAVLTDISTQPPPYEPLVHPAAFTTPRGVVSSGSPLDHFSQDVAVTGPFDVFSRMPRRSENPRALQEDREDRNEDEVLREFVHDTLSDHSPHAFFAQQVDDEAEGSDFQEQLPVDLCLVPIVAFHDVTAADKADVVISTTIQTDHCVPRSLPSNHAIFTLCPLHLPGHVTKQQCILCGKQECFQYLTDGRQWDPDPLQLAAWIHSVCDKTAFPDKAVVGEGPTAVQKNQLLTLLCQQRPGTTFQPVLQVSSDATGSSDVFYCSTSVFGSGQGFLFRFPTCFSKFPAFLQLSRIHCSARHGPFHRYPLQHSSTSPGQRE